MWQRRLTRLKASLKQRGLLPVMDEVLSSNTFSFKHSTLAGRDALYVFLGYRPQYEKAPLGVRAYITNDRPGHYAPIVFRDEVPVTLDGVTKIRLYRRTSSSLLRKAWQLLPPFCFLQFEPYEGVKGVCDMIDALVAYYALIAGLSDCAIRWPRFEACLIAALEYINTRIEVPAAEQEIQHKTESKVTVPKSPIVSQKAASKRKVPSTTTTTDMTPKRGGGVRQPTKLAIRRRQQKKSLVVKLKLDRNPLVLRLKLHRGAVAEKTRTAQLFEAPNNRDEGLGFGADKCNSSLDNEVDSVIGEGVDSVIGDGSDSVIGDDTDGLVVTADRLCV
jgi:hypothetical protein